MKSVTGIRNHWKTSEKWMKEVVAHLYDEYEITKKAPTVFRNRKGSYHHRPGGRHQIVFGRGMMEYWWENGYRDYKSVQPQIRELWSRRNPITELEALYFLTIHEFAHVLQTEEPNGRTYGSVHNETFIRKYRELLVLFPFDEMVEKFLPNIDQMLLGFRKFQVELARNEDGMIIRK